MANIYVRSTDGSDADSGATWALAKATLTGAAAIDAAGDTIYVSQAHAEAPAAADINATWAGTLASPTRIICANDGAEPPTAVATTATLTTAGGWQYSASGSNFYTYGLTFLISSGASAAGMALNSTFRGFAVYEACNFKLMATSGGAVISCGSTGTTIELINCGLLFSEVTQNITIAGAGAYLKIRGGSLLAGGTSPTALFKISANAILLVEGFDLSNANAAINLVGGTFPAVVMFKNVKLPASWSGTLNSTAPTVASSWRFELNNTDSTNTNYRLWIKDSFGDITSETTLIRTGGANNGVTGLSWKFVSTADAKWQCPLVSCEFVQWNSTTGASKTVTVEIVHDSVTNLKDSEVWLKVQYLSASGTPLGTFINDGSADILATGADQTASTATWTTTGMTNPNKQKLAVTFTPQMAGFIHAKVMVAKASYTLYVDPKITVT